ncbi:MULTISPECIES: CCC motif membrane protein [Galbibacter]|uniref:CCC motif membrane protein n=1 Tax=Galbibacter pacificus TaxID=2996052 RepID=A0ABT6FV28_9FLAO|nr:CCC motif membrane protein [Galbibacter pacificus]MDG3583400.1 CCC motif membrane protein [Galbibacter pacificus]MDG3587123.1 CCC motif membrane protein [Galbibacter pacificus]
MEQQKLPNVTVSLVLGIISFIACCCSSGIGGLLFSGIAFYLVKKDEKTYQLNPENYSNYKQLKTAKTVAIVGLVLSIIALIIAIVQIAMYGGIDGYLEYQQEMLEQYGIE